MKLLLSLFLLPLLLTSTAQPPRFVTDEGPSAIGSFETFSDRGGKLHIEFHAEIGVDGKTTGETIFRDDSEVPLKEPAAANTPDHPAQPLLFKAQFDCLVVKGNKAVMSGSVIESTWE